MHFLYSEFWIPTDGFQSPKEGNPVQEYLVRKISVKCMH